jgi:hypothetical protein
LDAHELLESGFGEPPIEEVRTSCKKPKPIIPVADATKFLTKPNLLTSNNNNNNNNTKKKKKGANYH